MMAEPGEQPDDAQSRTARDMSRKAQRKLNARRRGAPGVLGGLTLFGLVGWSVAVPTLLGVAVGFWLDNRWPGTVSWTIVLLFAGIALGCANAWYWVKRESARTD